MKNPSDFSKCLWKPCRMALQSVQPTFLRTRQTLGLTHPRIMSITVMTMITKWTTLLRLDSRRRVIFVVFPVTVLFILRVFISWTRVRLAWKLIEPWNYWGNTKWCNFRIGDHSYILYICTYYKVIPCSYAYRVIFLVAHNKCTGRELQR